MCSPQNKWNVKSTLFPLTELDGDGLESCCGVLDMGRVPHSDQMITGRGWEHHILMVPRRPGHSRYGMVAKRRSDHLDLHSSAPGTSTHTGKYFECGIPEKPWTGSFCSRRSSRWEGTGIGRNSIYSRDRHRGSVVMAPAQSDQSYMCTGLHQDGVLDVGSQ
jgi:hypothetical protein